LKPIFNDHLFRIRKWSKNERIYDFTKDEIDEFKGISLYQEQRYPYERAIRILEGVVEKGSTFPFQITSPIINGKRFFEYVDFYIALREELFDSNKNDSINLEFTDFYNQYCYDYYGWWRSGDQKARNLYENIVMAFVDRFGYVDDFENFYKAFYKLTYFIRYDKQRVSEQTILNNEARQIFSQINNAISSDSLKNYQYKTYKTKNANPTKGVNEIKEFIEKLNGK